MKGLDFGDLLRIDRTDLGRDLDIKAALLGRVVIVPPAVHGPECPLVLLGDRYLSAESVLLAHQKTVDRFALESGPLTTEGATASRAGPLGDARL